MWRVIFLAAFKILCIWLHFQFGYTVFCCGSLWVHLAWVSQMFILMYYIKFNKLLAIILFKYPLCLFLSLFFSGIPKMHMLLHLMMPHRLCTLFLIIFFQFFRFDNIYCPIFRISDSFLASSNLPMNSFTDFFSFQWLYFSAPECLFGFLGFSSLYWYSPFVIHHCSLLSPCLLFSPLSTF